MRIDRIKLFTAIKEKDMSQKKLAELSEVSASTINNVMHGRSCSDIVAARIAGALNVRLSELAECAEVRL